MKKSLFYLFTLFLIGIFIIPCVQAVLPKKVDVLFLGDQKVGKSYLRSVLTGNAPDTMSREYTPTIETNFVTSFLDTRINGRQIALLYWDSPGAPEVREQLTIYGAQGCQFIVLAINLEEHTYNPQTREGVDIVANNFGNYIVSLRNLHRDAYLIVCGTKKDLVSPEKTRPILAQFEPYKNLDSYRNHFNCIATSSTEDPESVMQIENIIKRVLRSGQINIDNLEDYQDSSYTKKTLPCGMTICKRKGCTIL